MPQEETDESDRQFSDADAAAKQILQQKVRDVWYSFKPVQWLNLEVLKEDCRQLVCRIAAAYFPDDDKPELHVTLVELLRFNERISFQIRQALKEFPTFQKISVATILDAKDLIEQTKETLDKKTVKHSRKIATRLWQAINVVNPNYWIQRVFFKSASQVVGRKVLTSIYRIVGNEAIRLYRSSVYHQPDQAGLQEEELDDWLEPSGESIAESLPENGNHEDQKKPDEAMSDEQEWIFPEEGGEESSSQNKKSRMQESIQKLFAGFVEGSLQLWDKLANQDKVVETFKKSGHEVRCLSDIQSLLVEDADSIADGYVNKGRWMAAAEGAATGLGGFLLLSADAVSLLVLQLRIIQQIGYCYGFDVQQPEEKLFAVKLLAESYTHSSIKERDALKKEMRTAAGLLQGKTPIKLLQKRLFVQGFTKVAEKMGIRLGSRKAAQILPFVGSAVGGIVNQKITKDIALNAQEIYRERFLQKQ